MEGGVISAISSIFTAVIGWIPQITGVIVSDPILILPIAFLVIGFVVGIISRIFGR